MLAVIYSKNGKQDAIDCLRSRRMIGFDKDGVIVNISELMFKNRLLGFEKHGMEFPYSSDTNYRMGGLSEKYSSGISPIEALIGFGKWYDESRPSGLSKDEVLRRLIERKDAVSKLDSIVSEHVGPGEVELAKKIYWWDGGRFFSSEEASALIKPCEGAKQAILDIANLYDGRVAIVTNTRSEKAVLRDLRVAGFDSSDISRLTVIHDAKKSSSDGINRAFRSLGVAREDVAYVGDTIVDVQAARNSGVVSISVLTGVGTKKQLKAGNTDIIVSSVAALRDILRG